MNRTPVDRLPSKPRSLQAKGCTMRSLQRVSDVHLWERKRIVEFKEGRRCCMGGLRVLPSPGFRSVGLCMQQQ